MTLGEMPCAPENMHLSLACKKKRNLLKLICLNWVGPRVGTILRIQYPWTFHGYGSRSWETIRSKNGFLFIPVSDLSSSVSFIYHLSICRLSINQSIYQSLSL